MTMNQRCDKKSPMIKKSCFEAFHSLVLHSPNIPVLLRGSGNAPNTTQVFEQVVMKIPGALGIDAKNVCNRVISLQYVTASRSVRALSGPGFSLSEYLRV